MSNPDDGVSSSRQMDPAPAIQRLLFVSDAAVADVDELPPAVRAIIDAATELYVLTPTLPGRLAWLADDVDRFRHYADERLDTVLSHMHTIGADAGGAASRGSVLTVIADAVTEFEPDHILIALHVPDHANWQERKLIEHIEKRFGLPVTTFAVDLGGHTPTADGPLLLCYDGSEDAKHAIERAGRLLGGRDALVVTVCQPTAALGSFAFAGATDSMFDFVKANRATAELGGRVAGDGVRIAEQAGLHAEPVAVEATGRRTRRAPTWRRRRSAPTSTRTPASRSGPTPGTPACISPATACSSRRSRRGSRRSWWEAVAAVASAGLFGALAHRRWEERARLGIMWFAAATSVSLLSGRLTFALGVAVALAALLALQRARWLVASGLAVLTVLASPAAGLFLAIAGAPSPSPGDRRWAGGPPSGGGDGVWR